MSAVKMNKMIHQAQKLAAAGMKQILENPSKILGAAVTWAHSSLEKSKAPQAVAGLVDTVADRAKVPRRVRKRSVKALKHGARELRHQSTRHQQTQRGRLLGGILLAAAVAGTIITVRLVRRQQETVAGAGKIDGSPAPQHRTNEPNKDSGQPETPERKDTGSDQAENPTIAPAIPPERTESP